MIVLGIESSCDETALALVNDKKQILSHVIYSQLAHKAYGGVVPEISARNHLERMPGLLKQVFDEAHLSLNDIDGVAATCGPGLIGGVLVGAMTGKALALGAQKPFMAINHLEGHALTPRLTHSIDFPYLLLLMSGGHSQILLAKGVGDYDLLGSTLDDALGECFDKTAKIMGFAYPGGPILEQLALTGNPDRFDLPRPLCQKPGCDFSFSGLKTAIRKIIEGMPALTDQDKADMAAGLHKAAKDILLNRLKNALQKAPGIKTVVASGGVAANQYLATALNDFCTHRGLSFSSPPLALCTDNGAMIAWAGLEYLRAGLTTALDFAPRPRWPLGTLK